MFYLSIKTEIVEIVERFLIIKKLATNFVLINQRYTDAHVLC